VMVTVSSVSDCRVSVTSVGDGDVLQYWQEIVLLVT